MRIKNPFISSDLNIRAAAYSFVITLCLSALSLFLLFLQLPDVPIGIFIGGTLSSFLYLLLGLVFEKDRLSGKLTRTIVITIVRYVLIAVLGFGSGFLYFRYNWRVINPFALIGAYMIPLIVNIILNLFSKNEK